MWCARYCWCCYAWEEDGLSHTPKQESYVVEYSHCHDPVCFVVRSEVLGDKRLVYPHFSSPSLVNSGTLCLTYILTYARHAVLASPTTPPPQSHLLPLQPCPLHHILPCFVFQVKFLSASHTIHVSLNV